MIIGPPPPGTWCRGEEDTEVYDGSNRWKGKILCLSDETIPIKIRIEWMWSKIFKIQPAMKSELWPNPDPWSIYEIVANNVCHFNSFPGAKVLDIGANQGIFSIYCAFDGARVTAYEPHPTANVIFHETVKRAGLESKIKIIVAAISDKTGTCFFHGTGKTWGERAPWITYNGKIWEAVDPGPPPDSSLIFNFGQVMSVSLEDAIGDQEWDCVKMDIEGGEFEAFRTVSDIALRKIKFLTLELHNDAVSKVEYDQLIKRLESIFEFTGVKDGSYASEDRWGAIYATRKTL